MACTCVSTLRVSLVHAISRRAEVCLALLTCSYYCSLLICCLITLTVPSPCTKYLWLTFAECLQCTFVLSLFSRWVVSNSFATPLSIADQAPLSMGFSRQAHWSGLPSPPPGDLADSEVEPESLVSPALRGGFFTTEPSGKACCVQTTF